MTKIDSTKGAETRSVVDWNKPVEQRNPGSTSWNPVEVLYLDSSDVLIKTQEGIKTFLSRDANLDYLFWRNKKESRAVPRDKWLDLTKPLEGFWTETDNYAGPIEYVGSIDGASSNFPSWFVCRWDDYNEGDYFLMRGDGKTDIPGLTVRNKSEAISSEVPPKLKLPLINNKQYVCRNGETVWLHSSYVQGHTAWNRFEDYDVWTGATLNYGSGWDIVEGPL